ncbi:hypothetical protein LguiB_011352 [Lonicera macranthoides]
MSSENLIDLCSDNEMGDSGGKAGEKRPHYALGTSELEGNNYNKIKKLRGNSSSSNVVGISQSGSSILEQGCCVDDESSPSFLPSLCPPPVCRQFWKAGNYEMEHSAKAPIQKGRNHLRVHPLFLHSNATSHKWAFGAIAELLDNAVDETQNGASFVVIDKMINPRDGSTALLIQDDGGGMDPEAIRRCMSFGFSEKKDKCAIGQYGNGFKTSSMRLGADVIVFSRHLGNRTASQSVGLLSYTFLRQSAQDRIVVPMVDYELNESTGIFAPVLVHGKAQFSSNLSIILQWSPFSTEEMLLKQFEDVGQHGTKVIVYNLWLNDDGDMELDFDSDVEDIRINADAKLFQTGQYANSLNDQHIANLYRYSLRVYASILYRHLPQSFKIFLRGQVVKHHNIAYDLKFPEFIVYKPQSLGTVEVCICLCA